MCTEDRNVENAIISFDSLHSWKLFGETHDSGSKSKVLKSPELQVFGMNDVIGPHNFRLRYVQREDFFVNLHKLQSKEIIVRAIRELSITWVRRHEIPLLRCCCNREEPFVFPVTWFGIFLSQFKIFQQLMFPRMP